MHTVWEPFTGQSIPSLERIQNRVVRFIYYSYGSAGYVIIVNAREKVISIKSRMETIRMKLFFF